MAKSDCDLFESSVSKFGVGTEVNQENLMPIAAISIR